MKAHVKVFRDDGKLLLEFVAPALEQTQESVYSFHYPAVENGRRVLSIQVSATVVEDKDGANRALQRHPSTARK